MRVARQPHWLPPPPLPTGGARPRVPRSRRARDPRCVRSPPAGCARPASAARRWKCCGPAAPPVRAIDPPPAPSPACSARSRPAAVPSACAAAQCDHGAARRCLRATGHAASACATPCSAPRGHQKTRPKAALPGCRADRACTHHAAGAAAPTVSPPVHPARWQGCRSHRAPPPRCPRAGRPVPSRRARWRRPAVQDCVSLPTDRAPCLAAPACAAAGRRAHA